MVPATNVFARLVNVLECSDAEIQFLLILLGEDVTKILVSTGYGAGWSTWAPDDKRKEIAEYQPVINFIEAGGNPEGFTSRERASP